MNCVTEIITLSQTGRPQLLNEEILVLQQDKVGVYDGDQKLPLEGLLQLTTLRVIFVESSTAPFTSTINNATKYPLIWSIDLGQIKGSELQGAFLTRHAKIQVSLLAKPPTDTFADQTLKKKISWSCPVCQSQQASALGQSQFMVKCDICGVCQQLKQNDVSVSCSACTFVNSSMNEECLMCQTAIYFKFTAEISSNQRHVAGMLNFSFRNGGSQDFFDKLQLAIASNAAQLSQQLFKLQQDQVQNSLAKQQLGASRSIGMSGLIASVQEQHASSRAEVSDATKDLDSLMSKAREIILMVKSMNKSQAVTIDNDDSSGSTDLNDLSAALQSVGLANPVSKDTHGDMFIKELAVQFADFMRPVVKNVGVVTLIDAYCLYNRARGVDLISPQELCQACELWPRASQVKSKTYPSGLKVLQSDDFDEELVISQAFSANQNAQWIDAIAVGELLKISIVAAAEILLAAEQMEKLCRDDSAEGLKFYINKFV